MSPFQLCHPRTKEEYKRYYHFRWRHLRARWGQAPGSERDALESSSLHIMACDNNNIIIGVGRLHITRKAYFYKQAQIRYMAVAPKWQYRGVASAILEYLESEAQKSGVREIKLNARQHALGFYLRKNYRIQAKSHTLYNTILHFRLKKSIAQINA